MMMCRTNKCPAWNKESSHALKSVKKRTRTLTQTIEGKRPAHSETELKVVTQEDPTMAVMRLITAAVRHCETQKSTTELKMTEAEHIRFVAAAAQADRDEKLHKDTWHDCIQSPETERYECQEQARSHTKQQLILITKHPGHTTSQIRRMQRARKVEAVTAQYQKSMAALEEAGDGQAEDEK